MFCNCVLPIPNAESTLIKIEFHLINKKDGIFYFIFILCYQQNFRLGILRVILIKYQLYWELGLLDETLILSCNSILHFNDTRLFSSLSNLKFLNLSSNRLKIIQSYLFDRLRIRILREFFLTS